MQCDVCKRNEPVRFAKFRRTYGVIIGSAYHEMPGNYCDTCLHAACRECNISTAIFGWWSIRSFPMSIICLTSNVRELKRAMSAAPIEVDASDDEIETEAVRRWRMGAVEAAGKWFVWGVALLAAGIIIALSSWFSDAGVQYGKRPDDSGSGLMLLLVCAAVGIPLIVHSVLRRRAALYGPPPKFRAPVETPAPQRKRRRR